MHHGRVLYVAALAPLGDRAEFRRRKIDSIKVGIGNTEHTK